MTASNKSQHRSSAACQTTPDPLYVIFEQHLFNFQDSEMDRKSLILRIVTDYLTFLRRKNITVPAMLEQPIIEELSLQVEVMITKKIYGCLSLDEFQKGVSAPARRKATKTYRRLGAG